MASEASEASDIRPIYIDGGFAASCYGRPVLPPTSPDLARDDARPYFLWWTDVTVSKLRSLLCSPDPDERAYWLGALLREANTRDVWLFVTPEQIRQDWSSVLRHLGRSREMWAYLLDLADGSWPPADARRA
jgi:hypothetical protein